MRRSLVVFSSFLQNIKGILQVGFVEKEFRNSRVKKSSCKAELLTQKNFYRNSSVKLLTLLHEILI